MVLLHRVLNVFDCVTHNGEKYKAMPYKQQSHHMDTSARVVPRLQKIRGGLSQDDVDFLLFFLPKKLLDT